MITSTCEMHGLDGHAKSISIHNNRRYPRLYQPSKSNRDNATISTVWNSPRKVDSESVVVVSGFCVPLAPAFAGGHRRGYVASAFEIVTSLSASLTTGAR